MVKVEDYETIRKRYFIDGWSIRKISRELKHCQSLEDWQCCESRHNMPQTSPQRKDLIPNLVAGLTTAIADIPDAMASAALAGANPFSR